ncbi:MAG TPA: phosphate ABC transporter substrate-binding protein PstS [Bordetella sp.]
MFMRVFKQATLGAALSAAVFAAHAADITGAGSSFAFPVYSKWATGYKAAAGATVNYQSVGSGAGIKQIEAKTVDFGASDVALSGEDLDKNGLIQFPGVVGGIVPVVNLAGVAPGQLKFTGSLLADIYMGKITKWNDAAIAKLNPGVKLPSSDIIPIYRSDASGTSYNYTAYLSDVSADWKSKLGFGTDVKWPVGQGGKGNEGVANLVKQFQGAIGYVEIAYSTQNKLTYGLVANKAGKYVEPNLASFTAAASNANWDAQPGMGVVLVDEPGDQSWPLTVATYVLVQKVQDKPASGAEVLKFFDYGYTQGKKDAEDLVYVPLPDALVTKIRAVWAQVKDASGKPVYAGK